MIALRRGLSAMGYDNLCRRSELVGLLIEDLRPLPDSRARILVRRAKTDPFGHGRWAHLSPPAMAHLGAWLAAAGIIDGPLFRPVISGKVGRKPMNLVTVNRTLKTAARRAGLSPFYAHRRRPGPQARRPRPPPHHDRWRLGLPHHRRRVCGEAEVRLW